MPTKKPGTEEAATGLPTEDLVENASDLTNTHTGELTFKGEMIRDKDPADMKESATFIHENPYKTPPNSLTTKNRIVNEKS